MADGKIPIFCQKARLYPLLLTKNRGISMILMFRLTTTAIPIGFWKRNGRLENSYFLPTSKAIPFTFNQKLRQSRRSLCSARKQGHTLCFSPKIGKFRRSLFSAKKQGYTLCFSPKNKAISKIPMQRQRARIYPLLFTKK